MESDEKAMQKVKLYTLNELADLIAVDRNTLYRAAIRNLFPCLRTSSRMYLVPSDDTSTLTTLANAARLHKDPELELSFYDAIRLAKRGVTAESQPA